MGYRKHSFAVVIFYSAKNEVGMMYRHFLMNSSTAPSTVEFLVHLRFYLSFLFERNQNREYEAQQKPQAVTTYLYSDSSCRCKTQVLLQNRLQPYS